ncbi:GNAT family N-acetyltransferase [Methylocystis sp. SC2]|uniref:GNAT family N-acetyltransferase n=1 Tax=Methylocystis sp. (strain SC2) TaxID=187303 RepID=UPI001FCC3A8E|nr:GNAT family N-acetyltransferase [Methylocystis sp. SC2]
MSYVVRLSTLSDAEAVSALLAASYSTLLASHYEKALLDRALPFMTRANPTLLASGAFYVAQSSHGELIGCGGWSLESPGTAKIVRGEAHIRHFATHPAWTRLGVARSIMNRCCMDAKARDVSELHCCSTFAAENFYKALGFKTIARADIPLDSQLSFPAVLMQRAAP